MDTLVQVAKIKAEDGSETEQFVIDPSKLGLFIESKIAERMKSSGDVTFNIDHKSVARPLTEAAVANKLSFKQLEGAEPAKFTGLGGPSVADTWISKMDSRVELMRSMDPSLSDKSIFENVVTFLDDPAYNVAVGLRADAGSLVSWSLLKSLLSKRFGSNKSSLVLLDELDKVQQSVKDNVQVFSNEFERKLDLLLAVTKMDALVVVKLFLKGLQPKIRESVMRNVLHDQTKYEALTKVSARAAVAQLIVHAQHCEHIDQFIASSNGSASVNAAVVVEPSVVTSGAASAKPTAVIYGSDSHVKKLATRYKLSVAVVRERLKNSQCVVCGVAGHIAVSCKSSLSAGHGAAAESPKAPTH
jgi:hypothetical protein